MKKATYVLLFLIAAMSCKEKYESPVIPPETGFLVVEGVINSGAGITDISLNRTKGLETRGIKFESGATVRVEAEDNTFWLLSEEEKGHYKTESLGLDASKKYRLSIKTKGGEEYQSDFLEVRKNPTIDNLSWVQEPDGVHIDVSTHDPKGEARYYRWEFTETWEHFSDWKRRLEFEITRPEREDVFEVVYRPSDDGSGRFFDSTMYYCWQEYASDKLLIGNTAKLTEDEINFPLAFVPWRSVKMNRLYSINVRQFSLNKEAYEFLEIMKRNTELTGSVFDAQPAILYSNIHNIANFDEPVIGYMTICPIQEKRIFIKKVETTNWRYLSTCRRVLFDNFSDIIKDEVIAGFLPTGPVLPPTGPFPGLPVFFAAPPECVDCRLTGTNIKPDYWPNNFYYE